MKKRRTPLSDQDQSVWWDEIKVLASSKIAGIILDDGCRMQIESEYAQIQKTVYWANSYKVGEFIPKHRDSEGDLQLIMPLILPEKDNGGNLLIYKKDKSEVVELISGQKFLFDATKTFHETTKLVSTSLSQNPIRVVCICRIFF
ncbi:MAG: hypothetical protein V3U92_01015 [Cellulophaga sp.]